MSNEAANSPARRVTKWTKGVALFSAINTASTSNTYGLGAPYANFGLMAYRASTGTSGGSTKVSYRLEGNIDGTTTFVTIGAATRAITTATKTLAALASTQGPITHVRARINSFTTATNANPDKVKFTLKIVPYT